MPLLKHLRDDTQTLLEQNGEDLDGTDSAEIKNLSAGQRGSVLIGRVRHLSSKETDGVQGEDINRPRANYYLNRANTDEFPDSSLLEPIGEKDDNKKYVQHAVDAFIEEAEDNYLPKHKTEELRQQISEHKSVFCTKFFVGLLDHVTPLKILLAPDAPVVLVKLRNYSNHQRALLKKMIADLLRYDMALVNPSQTWAWAPLLGPKVGLAKSLFTVNLRPVNRGTRKYG